MNRTFSKLGKGSLRGSIFSLCASAIGSGVLSLPLVFKLCGYIEGILLMILGATAALVSLRMLAGLAVDHQLPNYSKIAIAAGGHKLNMVLSAMIMLFMFGSCISYQIIITSLFKYILQTLSSDLDFINFCDTWKFRAVFGGPVALLILFPLSIKKDMSAFRYVSIASIAGLLYTAVVLAIELKEYNKVNKSLPYAAFYWDLNFFTGCSMNFFAFQCQV